MLLANFFIDDAFLENLSILEKVIDQRSTILNALHLCECRTISYDYIKCSESN